MFDIVPHDDLRTQRRCEARQCWVYLDCRHAGSACPGQGRRSSSPQIPV